MLMPKKVKHRKQMRGRRAGKAWLAGELADATADTPFLAGA